MTRRQHRKYKSKKLEDKKMHASLTEERPEWADFERETIKFEDWKVNFLKEVNEAVKNRGH